MSIQEHLNKIRNAIYGRDVRESIAKGIETAYEDASEKGNANMEVRIARGLHPNLRARLDEVDDKQQKTSMEVAQKVDRDGAGQVTWVNIAQDAREQISGDKVAVVGKDSVSTENIVDDSITHEKISYMGIGKNLFDKSTVEHDMRVSWSSGSLFRMEGISTSEPIKVTPLETYHRNFTDSYAILDINGDRIDGEDSKSNNNIITIPENGSHIILSVETRDLDRAQFERGTRGTSYKAYGGKISKEIDLDIQTEDLPIIESGPSSKNLLSRHLVYSDSRVDLDWNPNNNSWVASVDTQALWTYFTIKVPVERNRTYHLHQELKTLSGDNPYYSTRIKDMHWEPGTALNDSTDPTLLSTRSENSTFNSGDNDFVFVNFYVYNPGTYEIKNAQVELGSHYTGYVEYEEATYVKPEYLSNILQPQTGKNLYDPHDDDIMVGQIIVATGIFDRPAYNTTGFIYVRGMKNVTASSLSATYRNIRAYAFYDANKDLIEAFGDATSPPSESRTIPIPDYVSYLRVSYSYDAVNYQLEKGQSQTEYEAYEVSLKIKPDLLNGSNVGSDNSARSYWEGLSSVWNGDSITQGYLSGGDPYPFKVGRTLGMSVDNQAIGGAQISAPEYPDLLDRNDIDYQPGKILLTNGDIVDSTDYDLSGFIDISEYTSSGGHQNVFLISPETLPEKIKSYGLYDENKNPIEIRGSQDEGIYQTNYPYVRVSATHKYIRIAIPKDATDAEVRYTMRYPIVWRYQSMPKDADLIYIAGGTNDWSYSAPIGEFEDRTPFTLYGAMHLLCEGLHTNYPGTPVVFATPITRFRKGDVRNGIEQKVVCEVIKEVCEYYSFPVLDMFAESGLDAMNPVHLETLFGGDTGGHPNDAGHAVMARRVTGYLKQLA